MDWTVALRLVNGIGSILALIILVHAARHQWGEWNFKTQQHWWALAGWTALGLEGSIESILLNVDPGPRTVFQTLVVAWTLRALTLHEKLESEPALKRQKNINRKDFK